jgi:prepilin-type N-terminal cleavage/methylation domain-containing protein
MTSQSKHNRGFTLIELLVVLAIVGVLAFAGAFVLGNRRTYGVRTVMDEVTGVLLRAQSLSGRMGRTVTLSVNGTWTGAGAPSLTAAGAFIMDGRTFTPGVASPDPYSGVRVGAPAEVYTSLYASNVRSHTSAGVATDAAANALADSIRAVPPFSTDASFLAAYNNKLCTGGQNNVVVDGATHRFSAGFAIVVVSLAAGVAVGRGPVGVLLVTPNSANVFRFYCSGPGQAWRRI